MDIQKKVLIIGVPVLLIIIGVLVYFWQATLDDETGKHTIETKIYDERLSDIYVLTTQDQDPAFTLVSLQNGNKEVIASQYEGNLIDYKESHNQKAALVLNGHRQDLLLKHSWNDEFTKIASDYKQKRGLTFSLDGKTIYFTEYDALESGDVADASSWMIKSYNIETGEYLDVIQGYLPRPIYIGTDIEGLLYTSDTGLSFYDTNSQKTEKVGSSLTGSVKNPIQVTPDGKYILVHNNLLDTYDVYTLTIADPLVLDPVFSIPESSIQTVSNTDVFFVDRDEQSVVAYTIDEEARGTDMYIFEEGDSKLPFSIISK